MVPSVETENVPKDCVKMDIVSVFLAGLETTVTNAMVVAGMSTRFFG